MIKSLFNGQTILFIFLLPTVLTFLFGNLLEQVEEGLAIPIAFVDEDHSQFSKQVIERLNQESRMELYVVTRDRAERLLVKNEVDSVYIIKYRFQENVLKNQLKSVIEVWTNENSIVNGIVQEVVASEVIRLSSNSIAANWVVLNYEQMGLLNKQSADYLWEQAYRYSDSQWEPEPLMTVNTKTVHGNGTETHPNAQRISTSPYIGLWSFFTMVFIIFSLDWLVKEKGRILPRIQTTSKGLRFYITKEVAIRSLLFCIQAGITFILFKEHLQLELTTINLFQMIYFINFIVLLIAFFSSLFSNVNTFYLISFLLVLVIGIFGGSFFPVTEWYEGLPLDIRWLFPQTILTGIGSTTYYLFLTLIASSIYYVTMWRFEKI